MLCGLIGRRGEPPAECGHLLASPYEKLADVGVLGRDAQIEPVSYTHLPWRTTSSASQGVRALLDLLRCEFAKLRRKPLFFAAAAVSALLQMCIRDRYYMI